MALDPDVRDFIGTGRNFAALTTLFDDGSPQTNIMWVGADDDHVLINTEIHRAKFANVESDPRVSVTVWDNDNPYRYVEVRGRVVDTIGGDIARDHIDELSQRYTGQDYANPIQSERIIVRISPERVVKRL
ncbi:MAG TPA: PPOX class F420-dependent oxidoreductase [Nitriliruptoraceae bacterium]|nr:PPOX class F420-dependent oxidoreductase [Nitriliruptoraceae bacterium]